MLQNLHVKNLALITETEVEFKEGLNILTGETGAGKSIIIGSVALALGEKVPKELLRDNEETALVELVFSVENPKVLDAIRQLGIETEDETVILSRKITSGRAIARINGEAVSASRLKEVASLLIDIHGQHDNQELLSAEKHLGFLDSYGAYPQELAAYTAAYDHMCDCAARLDKLQMDESYKLQRMDILGFQLKEIGDAKLIDGEEEQLQEQQKRIRNAERITESLGAVYTLLNGDGEERRGALEILEEVSSDLDTAAKFLPEFEEYGDKLNDAYYMLEELGARARDTLEDADFDPRQLDAIESRLDTIYKLKKKYGGSIAAILEYYDKISRWN